MQHKPNIIDEQRARGPFLGVDWSQSANRPGAFDHLRVLSLRGELRVPHRDSAGVGVSSNVPRFFKG